MKIFRSMMLMAAFAVASFAQTGPGTMFFFGTHHYADQMLEPYPIGGLSNWYIVRAPTAAAYETFQNFLDVHSITVTKNGVVLTALQGPGEPPADYGYFVLSSFTQSAQVVIILAGPVLPTDRLRVSYDYVQQSAPCVVC
jgi:hypothetical protein